MAQFPMIPSGEATELTDDIRQLFADIARTLPGEQRTYSSECHLTLDVIETETAVEITVDAAGVPAAAVRVLFRAGVLLIVGEKAPLGGGAEQTYHLVEREFGRFARSVQLKGAFDVSNARATLRDGELTIVLPKLEERRGTSHRIPVAAPGSEPRP